VLKYSTSAQLSREVVQAGVPVTVNVVSVTGTDGQVTPEVGLYGSQDYTERATTVTDW
jgi:hypothetical protein